jgi:hypothetical protein
MKNRLIRKGLVVGIIGIFLLVSFIPSINSTSLPSSQKKMVHCQSVGLLENTDREVELTESEINTIQHQFNVYQNELAHAGSPAEAATIFREFSKHLLECNIIDTLTKNQLDMQLDKWILGMNYLEKREINEVLDSGNTFCLVFGNTSNSWSINLFRRHIDGFVARFVSFVNTIASLCPNPDNVYLLFFPLYLILWYVIFFSIVLFPLQLTTLIPFGIMNQLVIGYHWDSPVYYGDDEPATGVISTYGLQENRTFKGNLFGQIKTLWKVFSEYYIGATGFTGLKIRLPDLNLLYIGFAMKVDVGTRTP